MAPRNQQPEMIFQNQVIAMTHDRNLWVAVLNPAHFNQRIAGNKGFPDLEIMGPGGVLYRELKTMNGMGPGGGLRPDQLVWRDRLLAAGQDYEIWTPRDLETGRIEQQLAAIEEPNENSNPWALCQLGITAGPHPDAEETEETGDHGSDADQAITPALSQLVSIAAHLITSAVNTR